MSVRLSRKMRFTLPLIGAIAFWCINAVLMRSDLTGGGTGSLFVANMMLFAVFMTSVYTAGIAWLNDGNRMGERTSKRGVRITARPVMNAFVLGLVTLGSGIGLTVAIASPYKDNQVWTRLMDSIPLIVPTGIVFSLVGSVVGDLGLNLRWLASQRPEGSTSMRMVALGVAVHVLWLAVGWLAVATLRQYVLRP
jgi:hypothetical protein